MFDVIGKRCAVGAAALVFGLATVTVASAQAIGADGVHNATHLGGAAAFYAPPLRSASDLKRMVDKKGMADDIRAVLRESGIPETADAVLATLAGASSSVRGATCDEATPASGVIVECDVQKGTMLQWMALRPNGNKGDRKPGRLERVRWAGDKPFKAYLFRVTSDYKVYTFILPVACSNLSLLSVSEVAGEPVTISVDRVCNPATGLLRTTVKASSRDLDRVQSVTMAINGQSAGSLAAPGWTWAADNRPGDYTFDATDAKGRTYSVERRTFRVDACPPPPEPKREVVVEQPKPAAPPEEPKRAEAVAPTEHRPSLFFDLLGGKERRTRPTDDGTAMEFSQCSPLIGLKLGIAKRFSNNWEVAGGGGVAISLASGDEKVRESALFVDVEVNKYASSGMFVGTGFSVWDLTRSDTITPAWLLHFGVPLSTSARHPSYFLVEGRLFFDHIGDIQNNYLVWAGFRFYIK